MVDPHPLVKPEPLFFADLGSPQPLQSDVSIGVSQLCELARVRTISVAKRAEFFGSDREFSPPDFPLGFSAKLSRKTSLSW